MKTLLRRERTEARADRRRLADELAQFRTEAERNDLNALLDAYPDETAGPVRDLLNRAA